MLGELSQLVDPIRLRVAGLVRVDADRDEHLLVQLCQLECRAGRVDAGAHRDDPLDTCRARPPDQR